MRRWKLRTGNWKRGTGNWKSLSPWTGSDFLASSFGMSWIPSSESGLFNGLRGQRQKKRSCFIANRHGGSKLPAPRRPKASFSPLFSFCSYSASEERWKEKSRAQPAARYPAAAVHPALHAGACKQRFLESKGVALLHLAPFFVWRRSRVEDVPC